MSDTSFEIPQKFEFIVTQAEQTALDLLAEGTTEAITAFGSNPLACSRKLPNGATTVAFYGGLK